VNRGVERGRVAAGGEDSDAFHKLFFPGKTRLAESWQKPPLTTEASPKTFFLRPKFLVSKRI
jgi:hypothetical protein